MYHHLDTPPPPSQLYGFQRSGSSRHRSRPWSPDAYDPLPSTFGSSSNLHESRESFNQLQRNQSPPQHDRQEERFVDDYPPLPEEDFPRLPRRSRRQQEASEVSVEALDLADYARTLRSRTRQAEDPYPPFPSVETPRQRQRSPVYPPSSYPPSSFPNFNRGGTRSSANTSTTHRAPRSTHSLPTNAGSSRRRPFSLPTSPYQSAPNLVHEPDPEQEIDITQFPSWSREWYNDSQRSHKPPHNDLASLEAYEMEAGFAPPKAFIASGSNSRSSLTKPALSPFDPAYIHPDSYPKRGDIFDDNLSYPSYSAPSYSNHEPLLGSGRDGVVPWSLDPPEYRNPPLDPQVKEERIRMLEHEFGDKKKKKDPVANSKGKEKDDGLLRDDEGKLVVGTPDGKGGLVTQGPRMRAAVRFLQFALAGAVGGPVVWAAVALKLDPAPPPAGKPPFYILAVLSPVTFLLLCYLFLIRPCTQRRRHPSSSPPGLTHPGMMVLPVPGSSNQGKGKGGKGNKGQYPGGKKGKKGAGPGGDVQVNLIVDPHAFGIPGEQDLSSSSESEVDEGGFPPGYFDRPNPNSYTKPFDSARQKSKDRAKRKRNKRRSLIASLKLEEEWRSARKWLRVVSFVDAGAMTLWAVAFGFVIAGSRCPGKGGEGEEGWGGWCTAYNASTAASCLLCVAFAVSLFFGVKDLYASKASPRTRV